LTTEVAALPAFLRRPTKGQLVGAGALALLVLAPFPFGNFGLFVGAFALVYAILGLSVVVVTGFAGMISLMPYSFAGVGATITGLAMVVWGWPFWLAIPLAAVATLPISILVGVASVRLKRLYLAIATLTFGAALGDTFFKWDAVTGGRSGWTVTKPRLGPIDFSGDLAFYILCLITILLLVWMVEGLRKSRLGRAMLAVKDNELEAQALGINVYKTKLTAFLLSGMLAGVGGAFLAILLATVTPTAFQSPLAEVTSILLVSLVVIGGIENAWGAFLGAISLVVQQQVFQGAEFFFLFFGVYAAFFLILFLLFRPGGLLQVGKIQLEIIRQRPVFGIVTAVIVVVLNLGIAYLFVAQPWAA
jgi:branched-chain amino acid transport system permease protein